MWVWCVRRAAAHGIQAHVFKHWGGQEGTDTEGPIGEGASIQEPPVWSNWSMSS